MIGSLQPDSPDRSIRSGSLAWTVLGLVGVSLLGFSLYTLVRSPSWHVRFAVEASGPAGPSPFSYHDPLSHFSLSALLPLVLLVIAAYYVLTMGLSPHDPRR